MGPCYRARGYSGDPVELVYTVDACDSDATFSVLRRSVSPCVLPRNICGTTVLIVIRVVFDMLVVHCLVHCHSFRATRFGSLNMRNDARWWVPDESYRMCSYKTYALSPAPSESMFFNYSTVT